MVKIVLIRFTNSKCTVLFVWLPDYKNVAFSVNVKVFMPWVRILLVVSGYQHLRKEKAESNSGRENMKLIFWLGFEMLLR